jgi:hypothetical protein
MLALMQDEKGTEREGERMPGGDSFELAHPERQATFVAIPGGDRVRASVLHSFHARAHATRG